MVVSIPGSFQAEKVPGPGPEALSARSSKCVQGGVDRSSRLGLCFHLAPRASRVREEKGNCVADGRYPFEKARFTELLLECNEWRKNRFAGWAFFSGMFFLDQEKWWGDQGPRATPHEGIDLCMYTDGRGQAHALDESTRIPVMFDGEVIKIEKDYLGQSVYVDHHVDDGQGRSLCTMYGHTRPADHILPGERIHRGEIIGSLTRKRRKTTGPRPHLHLTMAWISPERALRDLKWDTLHDPEIAMLLDPLHAVDAPYRILGRDHSVEHF